MIPPSERIDRKREKLSGRLNRNKKGVTFTVGEWVLTKACNVNVKRNDRSNGKNFLIVRGTISNQDAHCQTFLRSLECQERPREREIPCQRSLEIPAREN